MESDKKWTTPELELHLAQVRKLNAEAALLEGQAAHHQADAENIRQNARMQQFNVDVLAPIQRQMQENTLRLQTAQVAAESATLHAKSRNNLQ